MRGKGGAIEGKTPCEEGGKERGNNNYEKTKFDGSGRRKENFGPPNKGEVLGRERV